MNAFKFLIAILSFLVLFSGCSTKRQYFEPTQVAGRIHYDGTLPASIIDSGRDGATLENGQIITKNGLLDVKIPIGFTFLGTNDERYIAVSRDSNLIIVDKNSKKVYEKKFDSIVASASLKDNMLAVVLGNNTSMLVDIQKDVKLFEKKGDTVYAHDSKIAAPYFLTELLIYPTLDGKLLILDLATHKVIRDVVVKSEKYFSNIIYLNVLGDRLVAATKKRVVSINPKTMTFLDDEIKDVVILKNRVLILTKDGRVLLTDADLKVLKEKKYQFASFAGTIHGKFAYIVERGGYLIAVDLDLISSNVYKLPDEIDSFIYTTDDKLFYKDRYFKFTRPNKK
jgi:hypothetical protein